MTHHASPCISVVKLFAFLVSTSNADVQSIQVFRLCRHWIETQFSKQIPNNVGSPLVVTQRTVSDFPFTPGTIDQGDPKCVIHCVREEVRRAMQLAIRIRQLRKNIIDPKHIDGFLSGVVNQGKDVDSQRPIAQTDIFYKILLRLVSSTDTIAAVVSLDWTVYKTPPELITECCEVCW